MVFDIRDTVSGVLGSVACVYVGMPFDVVKVRLQTSAKLRARRGGPVPAQVSTSFIPRNPLHCASHIIATEGVRRLWTGSIPALTSAISENAALFTANDSIKRFVSALVNEDVDEEDEDAEMRPLSKSAFFLCGGLAGFVSSTVMCPSEVVKIRLQVASGREKFKGPWDCARKTLQSEGVRGLFRGYSALLMRDMPFNALMIGSYDSAVQITCQIMDKDKTELHSLIFVLLGGLAGAFSWGVVFPVDVVKSRMQSQEPAPPLLRTARTIFEQEGVRGFYRGWSAAVLRALPANAALWGMVELTRRVFQWFDPTYRTLIAAT